jgi:hypothetical protein
VLKINFEKIPSGRRKIDSGEYALMEAARKRQTGLSKNEPTQPVQHYEYGGVEKRYYGPQ